MAIAWGRVIACANHVLLLDGLLIAFASPAPLVFAVDTDFSRRSMLARRGLQLLCALGFGAVVPLDRTAPFGVHTLRRVLNDGHAVMIFPEGRISPDGRAREEQRGVEWLAYRTGAESAEIVTLHIEGAARSRLFARHGTDWWPEIHIHG